MTFDKSKVYTALNAEELEVGSEVIVAYDLDSLKHQVEANSWPTYIVRLDEVLGPDHIHRFKLLDSRAYNLAYLVRKVGEVKQEEEKWVVYLAKEQDFSRYLNYCAESFWAWGDAKPKLFVGTHEEAKEWCQSRRKFLKVIKAWEDGKQIQYWDKQRGCWFNVNEPSWNQDKEYRVKLEEEKWIVYLARYQDELALCCCVESYWETAKKFDGAKRKLFVGSESETKEWYKSHQKFAEVIKAFEDGKTIQYSYDPDEEWVDVEGVPAWNVSTKYRVKPDEDLYVAYVDHWEPRLDFGYCARWNEIQKYRGAKNKLFIGSKEECKAWCDSHDKFVEEILAWENGKELQFRPNDNHLSWQECANPSWDSTLQYRVKPDCPCEDGIDSKACVGCKHSEDGKPHTFENYHCYICDKSDKKYRPYKSSGEMIADFIDRFKVNYLRYEEPSIWVKNKQTDAKFLITGIVSSSCVGEYVEIHGGLSNMNDLFDTYTYLDGSPVGMEVEE